jgi:uncharacterized membrane protein (DUF106 family)
LENPIENIITTGFIDIYNKLFMAWEGFKKTEKYDELKKADEQMIEQMNNMMKLIKEETKSQK